MPDTLLNINGVTVKASNVDLPADRDLRDAWQLNGDVVEIDMTKAKAIRAEQLLTEANEEAEKAAKAERKAEIMGDTAAAAAARVKKERRQGTVKAAGRRKLADATTPAELAAVTVDDLL